MKDFLNSPTRRENRSAMPQAGEGMSPARSFMQLHMYDTNLVMPALVAGIHVLNAVQIQRRGWPGRSPAMTMWIGHGHHTLSDTPASVNVAIPVWHATAARRMSAATAAPDASPSRMPRSISGLRPSSSRSAR